MNGTDCTGNYVPPVIEAGDNAWIMVSAALVCLMTPGLGMFYGGLVGSGNVVNTIMMSLACGCFVIVQWLVFGYTFAFGSGTGGFGSFEKIGLMGVTAQPNIALAPTVPEYAFVTFQMTFAMITPALISGAIAGRLKFRTWLVFILVWSTVCYDLVAHWVWASWVTGYIWKDGVCTPQFASGWLREMGALDFAGGAVVHVTCGFSALTAAIFIGKRKSDHELNKPHNIPLVLIGTALLWFGWFGFNGGSALQAEDGVAALAILNSNVAAGMAFATWVSLDAIFNKRMSVLGGATGAIVGLATVTPACGYINPASSLAFGFVGAFVAYFSIKLKEKIGYDDVLDVFACHGMGGTMGVIMLGLFAQKSLNPQGADGAFFGNPKLLGLQVLTAVVTAAASVILTLGILIILKYLPGFGLTVSEEKETLGMDFAAHREISYRFQDPEKVQENVKQNSKESKKENGKENGNGEHPHEMTKLRGENSLNI